MSKDNYYPETPDGKPLGFADEPDDKQLLSGKSALIVLLIGFLLIGFAVAWTIRS